MGLDTFMGAYPDATATQGYSAAYPAQVQNSLYPTGPFPSAGPGRHDPAHAMLSSQAYPSGSSVDGTLLSLTGGGIDGTGGAGQYGGFAMDRSTSGSASQPAGMSNMLVDDSYWNALIDGGYRAKRKA